MEVNRFSGVMRAQQRNLTGLQVWMRGAGVACVDVRLDPSTMMAHYQFRDKAGRPSLPEAARLRQTVHDAGYEESEERDISPIEAVREIVRFSISSDPLVRDLANGPGAGFVIPDGGPLQLVSEAADIRISPRLIN